MKRGALGRPGAAAAVVALLFPAGPARAAEGDKGAAQALFEQGRALVQEKKFAEACPKFAESLKLDPGIGTMLWLADCYENSGKTASGWAEFNEAAATATLHQDPRAALARRRADEIEPKLARLVIMIPPQGSVPGLEVRRDGVVLGTAELGVPVPVDPGFHQVSATAAGKKGWSMSVPVPDKPGTVSVYVPVLPEAPTTDEPTAALPSSAESPTGQVEVPRPVEVRAWGPRQTAAVATAGGGLVAIGVGSAFGIAAKSTYDDWYQKHPQNGSERASASTQAAVSTALFIVGGAAIAGGAVIYLTAPKTHNTVALVPSVSPGQAGMTLSTRW